MKIFRDGKEYELDPEELYAAYYDYVLDSLQERVIEMLADKAYTGSENIPIENFDKLYKNSQQAKEVIDFDEGSYPRKMFHEIMNDEEALKTATFDAKTFLDDDVKLHEAINQAVTEAVIYAIGGRLESKLNRGE